MVKKSIQVYLSLDVFLFGQKSVAGVGFFYRDITFFWFIIAAQKGWN